MAELVRIEFQGGTLRVLNLAAPEALEAATSAGALADERDGCHRAPAVAYADLVRAFTTRSIPFEDAARRYEEIDVAPRAGREPFPHQLAAFQAWSARRCRGVVVLPTGAGKTHVAMMAIAARKRSALVVVPTLDLMHQWYDALTLAFDRPVGLVGGGSHEVLPLTVTTYDSAHIHMDRHGSRFGLVVFDECHHLPSEAYATAARMCIAPFRLGLTATPERTDGREAIYTELVGPIAYRLDINELSGTYLAPYDVVRIEVPLSPAERDVYEEARAEYIGYLRQQGIRMGSPDGWSQFVMRSSGSEAGRRAMAAYRKQRGLALAAPGKLQQLEGLLHEHRHDQTLVFTEHNAAVHEIARRFLIPAITHQTKVKERSEILRGLMEGRYFAIATSKVLNEGVDVPSARVAIVLSGSGSVREHVQRLGRVLRRDGDKRALLYELVSAGTSEERTSDKRRDHVAYR